MSEPWCKGNYAHGNACGQCSRCKESLETIISESRRHKSERNALSVRALDLERRLTAALDDCETLRSAVAQLRKELDESRAKLRVMDDEYTKLAALRSDLAAELFEVLRKYGFVPYE
jgi:chromosome segregation ATPase